MVELLNRLALRLQPLITERFKITVDPLAEEIQAAAEALAAYRSKTFGGNIVKLLDAARMALAVEVAGRDLLVHLLPEHAVHWVANGLPGFPADFCIDDQLYIDVKAPSASATSLTISLNEVRLLEGKPYRCFKNGGWVELNERFDPVLMILPYVNPTEVVVKGLARQSAQDWIQSGFGDGTKYLFLSNLKLMQFNSNGEIE